MKNRRAPAFVIILSLLLAGAAVPSGTQDIADHPSCPICGMDRNQYGHSRMLIDYREGHTGTCSIHCAGADLAVNRHKHLNDIYAAEYNGRQLIPARSAAWVIGGDRTGVMTRRAKWAFAKKEDAEAFVRQHGGTIGTYEDAMRATFEDMYQDIKAVRDRSKERGKGSGR